MRKQALLGWAAIGALAAADSNWWGFRGPGGNATSDSRMLPTTWSATENIAWKTPLPGRGHSSPIIVGDRIFLTTSIEGDAIPGQKAPEHRIQGETFLHPDTTAADRKVRLDVLCFDKKSGRQLWQRTAYEGPVYDGRHTYNTFASPTPVSDGKRVFVSFETQGLYAYGLDGRPAWKASIGKVAKLGLGAGTSPVIAANRLIVVADEDGGENSWIYGLSLRNGEVLWKTRRKASVTWNTPSVVRHSKQEIVVAAATENVVAYDPATGRELWQGPGIQGFGAASAVSGHGLVFPNAYHPVKKVLALRVDPAAAERVAWTFDKGTAYIPSPVLYGDLLYLMAGNGALTALDARTGKLIYEGKRVSRPGRFAASPVAFDNLLLLTNEEGDTYVIQAGAEHQELRRNSIGEPVYASPALDQDAIYIRGSQHLYRISAKPRG